MEFLDARRLTGPNLIMDRQGAILDVGCSVAEAKQLLPVWQSNVSRMLAELGWDVPAFESRLLVGGVSLAFSAPVDTLYAASEINEWAWAVSAAALGEPVEVPDFEATVAAIRESAAEESNPRLLHLRTGSNRVASHPSGTFQNLVIFYYSLYLFCITYSIAFK